MQCNPRAKVIDGIPKTPYTSPTVPPNPLQTLSSTPPPASQEPSTPLEAAPMTEALARFLQRADRASLAGYEPSDAYAEDRRDLYARYTRFSAGDSLSTSFTDSQLALYLVNLSQTGQHRKACVASGVAPLAIQLMRRRDKEFNEACVEARKLAVLELADEVFRRGFEGVEETIYFQGEPCGTKINYSDAAAFKMLEAEMPDKFTKRTKNENINTVPSSAESDLARKTLVDIIVAAAGRVAGGAAGSEDRAVDAAIDITPEPSE